METNRTQHWIEIVPVDSIIHQQTGGEKEVALCPHDSLHENPFKLIRNVKLPYLFE